MTRKLIYLTLVSFFVALVHSCSLNNNILTPPCKVFETDLTDRWWYPEAGSVNDGIYFDSDGTCVKRNSTDSITYTLNNCNKLNIVNHTLMQTEELNIGKLRPDNMTILKENGNQETYTLRPVR
jgi:hypothetical protein